MSKEEVNNFIFAFEDLVKSYSRNLITNNSNVSSNSKKVDLFRFVEKGEKAETINYDTVEKSGFLNEKFNYFMYILEKTTFDHGLIPYDKVTDIVFSGAPEDIQYSFTEELIKQGTKYFEKKEPEIKNESFERNKTCFYKIVRHINLALVQKNSISARKIEQITELQNANEKLNSQYLQLKRDADKQIEAIKKEATDKYEALKNDMEKQYKGMMSQYISILGIFAGILIGAFGALQGFTSLFNNADDLPIGKILIISSIGASSVLLILFFLLNGVAKLIGKDLSSHKEKNAHAINKHPTLVIGYGILILVSLIGTSLELCNAKVRFSWQGLWWLLPLGWVIYFVYAIYKEDFLFPITKIRTKQTEKKKSITKNSDASEGSPQTQ